MPISNTGYLLIRHLVLLIFLAALPSCPAPATGEASFNYGTTRDSALHYYQQGWQQIMDYGQWTAAEQSFRKAAQLDSAFLLANAVYGRITSNVAEKKRMLQLSPLEKATPDQQLLLEVYNMGNRAAVSQSADSARQMRVDRIRRAEKNYRKFVHKYPGQSYEKAEYIEVLHALYGPERALDSLDARVTFTQRKLPFFISYEAMMYAESDRYEEALKKIKQLEKQASGKPWPCVPFTKASVYYEMDSLDLALKSVNRAIEMDSAHLIAAGLKEQIEARQSK